MADEAEVKAGKTKVVKKRKKWTRRAKPPGEAPDAIVAVASVKDASPADLKRLLAEIDGLKAQLASETEKRTEAEAAALSAAEAQGFLMQHDIEEVPTGKMVTIKKCTGYKVVGHKDDGRDILRPEFEDVKVPTYFYKIDLPPCGGTDAKINGVPFYHGTVYEFDIDTLRTIKDIVYRCWKHDSEIHGTDENFYRKPQKPVLRGSARQ
jgi:hypothetical protein